MNANSRMLALVKEEYIQRIPHFIYKHATKRTCQKIKQEFPDLYRVFSQEAEPDEEAKQQMQVIVNQIFEERMQKHHMFIGKGE